ncbi:MAG: DNA topoisomerase III [Candidatus Methylacidiphilales bacterium]|nr:DNA topoisomerase III [Candidatus Methylacidiphilales bacterium]
MGKALIIAEKPSVAGDIARALGGFTRHDDYYESDKFVLSSAIGHLVELSQPSEFDRLPGGKWSFQNLPVIPEEFALKPIAKTESRLKLLRKLLKREDVDNVINACDAGREGELIFRYIVKICKSSKPIRRLWLQSMTPQAVRDGFNKLKPGKDLEPLATAAMCRSESDWLVGINGTRALTAFNNRNGGFQKTTVGRVQTPTLAVVVERDAKIKAFVAKDYWELHATFGCEAGEYSGRWFDEKFKKHDLKAAAGTKHAGGDKVGGIEDEDRRPERFWDRPTAEVIQKKCAGKPGVVTEEKKPSTQLSPLLYDLTTLQREANGRFGLSAKRTLQIAQALYEKHKVLTYPRTDSRALPEDYVTVAKDVAKALQSTTLAPFATQAINQGWIKPNKRIFNNTKVSDHHAIIPTLQSPANLDDMERKVYEMVAKRFLAVFFPAAVFEITTRITRVEGEPFKTDGKILKEAGWLAIYGKEEQKGEGSDNQPALVAVKPSEKVATKKIDLKSLVTKPPAHFNEATLLSAMEGAGKLVEDEELREAMAAKGLGTPATRASIIEGLILEEYLRREGRDLMATPKAFALIELLRAVQIPALTSPEMTGEWEYKLKQMEGGNLSRDSFMKEIVDLTRLVVERARGFQEEGVSSKPLDFNSPDGKPMVETLRNYQTADGSFQMRKVIAGRLLEPHEAQELVEKKLLGPLQGFRSRLGRAFAAVLRLADNGAVEFVFDNEPVNASGEKLDFSEQEPIGKCPVCGHNVYEAMAAFICEQTVASGGNEEEGAKPKCKFKITKNILQQEINAEQAGKLLNTGTTDLLTKFISKKNNRPFSAFLVLDNEHKVVFKFQEREAKPGAKPGGFKRGGAASAPAKESDDEPAAKSKAAAAPASKGKKAATSSSTAKKTTRTSPAKSRATAAAAKKSAGSATTSAKGKAKEDAPEPEDEVVDW